MKHYICLIAFLEVLFVVGSTARVKRDLDENGRVIQCQPQTPCGWVIYIPSPVHRSPMKGYRESHLSNDYCTCPPGTECLFQRHNAFSLVDEYRCQNANDKRSHDGEKR